MQIRELGITVEMWTRCGRGGPSAPRLSGEENIPPLDDSTLARALRVAVAEGGGETLNIRGNPLGARGSLELPLHDSLDRTDPHLPCLGEHGEDRARRVLRHAEALADLRWRHLALSLREAAKDITVERAPEIDCGQKAHGGPPVTVPRESSVTGVPTPGASAMKAEVAATGV